jgi:hypothetical protein
VSSTPYGETLEINIRPSRLIATLLFAIHVTAAAVCVQLPLALFDRLLILLAVIGSLMWNTVIYWRRTPRRLRWSLEGGWSITDSRGITHNADLIPETYMGSWFVIAYFRTSSGKRRAVMLARDSCRAEDLRRLRILLKYGAPKA